MAEMTASAGADPETGVLPVLGHARLRWGARWSRASSLYMRSELDIEDAGPDSLTGMIAGRHDAHVRFGLGPERGKGVGADVIARARFHHLGDARRALAAVDTGPGAHTEAVLSLSTALRFRRPTKVLEDVILSGRVHMMSLPGITSVEGGLPLVVDGEVVGSIGVSGVQSSQDGQVAAAGAAALASQ